MRTRFDTRLSSCFLAAIISMILVVSIGVPLRAQPSLWVEGGLKYTFDTASRHFGGVVGDSKGNAIVAWCDYEAGSIYTIRVQKYSPYGEKIWGDHGVAASSPKDLPGNLMIIEDGSDGVILVWRMHDSTTGYDIWAQRIDRDGDVLWGDPGVPVCDEMADQTSDDLVSDGSGGVIVSWNDWRAGNQDIYAQRLASNGTQVWTSGGVAVCTAADNQSHSSVVEDGAGGAFVVWDDERGADNDIYGAKLDSGGTLGWSDVVICDYYGHQEYPVAVTDDDGGAILAWIDFRSTTDLDIYAQRLDPSCALMWNSNGVAICTADGNQNYPNLVPDGKNGVIIAWDDQRSGTDWDIYAQRILANSAREWEVDGIAVCDYPGDQQDAELRAIGSFETILTWEDARNGTDLDIYAQLLGADGTPAWKVGGSPVCVESGFQASPSLTTTLGGDFTYVAWSDERVPTQGELYIQRLDEIGFWGYSDPILGSVLDVPGDEGGSLRLTVGCSDHDKPGTVSDPITGYNLWKKIDPVSSASAPAGDLGRLEELLTDPSRSAGMVVDGAAAVSLGLPAGTWESLGFNMAVQQPAYYYTVETEDDSSGTGTPWEVFVVTAHTAVPSVYFSSAVDSGYSVDDLPPAAPANLEGEPESTPPGIRLTWDMGTEPDLDHYAVYRGETEGFVPGPGNLLGTSSQLHFEDDHATWYDCYYKVSAVDVHGNESPFAVVGPGEVTGDGGLPSADYLAGNYPNPFNPSTTISFGLSEPGEVRLSIYDAAGRLVRALIDGQRPAGRYDETWDGKTDSGHGASSGIYFCRLSTRRNSMVRKIVLLR